MFNAIAEKPTCDESMKHNTPQIICDQTHLKLYASTDPKTSEP
jgi:hypothetical protein